MLRLWPKHIYAGLFPRHCWLLGHPPLSSESPSGDIDDMLVSFDALLGAHAASLRKGTLIELTVSDSIAVIVTLHWQSELGRKDELHAYARSCLEHQGMPSNDSWVSQYDYLRFGEMGIAYAIPRTVLDNLVRIAAKHEVKLASVLPVSVVAYGRRPKRMRDGVSLVLLNELQRCSALVFNSNGLLEHVIEPATGGSAAALKRLLTRVASNAHVNSIDSWTSLQTLAESTPAIRTFVPTTTMKLIDREVWSRA